MEAIYHHARDTMHELIKRQGQTKQGSSTDQSSQSSSASAVVSTVLPILIISLVCVAIFLIFRTKFQRIYEPRTFVGKFRKEEMTPMPKKGIFGWIGDFKALPDDFILNHQSLDGYLYLRYIKIVTLIFLAGCLITWPILFPINATAPAPKGAAQFDLLSFSNSVNSPNRYYAHAFIAWVFFGMVLFVIARESLFYIHLRQAWLLSPQTASRMSSRTVLFTDVPSEYLNEATLRQIFPYIKHVWMASDTTELQKSVKDRDKTAMKLESAEIKLSKTANAQRLKMQKKNTAFENPLAWVDDKKRPTHKLKPLIGQKVDTIDWCRGHLQTAIPEVENMQASHWNGQAKMYPACFIEFETIQAAEAAFQQLVFHKPKVMQPRAIGMAPNEVVWSNLKMKWIQRDVMYAVGLAIVTLMIIFWVPFTALVGAISNINYLTQKVTFLSFINKIPKVILGVVTGLLPSVMLAILMALVPIFLRLIAKLTGCVTVGEIELQVQNWYFVFQVIQVFLVTTFSSAAASVGAQIAASPGSAPSLLAQNIPKASNFYISYVMFSGISAFGSTLLNIAALAIFIILKNLLMKTPRKRYTQYLSIAGLGWGSTYPKIEIFVCIAMTYSIIVPLVMGFTVIGLILFYVANRYMLMYVLDTSNISTQGATYPRALQHIMVGVYLCEVCIIGLLGIEAGSHPAAAGPLIIMVILLVFTILAHISIRGALKPLTKNLPRDLLYASSHRTGVETQMEDGKGLHSALGQTSNSVGYNNGHNDTKQNSEAVLNSSKHQPGIKGKILRIIHPSWLPPLAEHLSVPVPDYPADVRREAYLDPAITSPTPLLWIVHDEMGISAREKELSGKVIGVTDQGAYWNEKGKLQTIWEGQPYDKQDALIRDAPIHEPRILY